ncbi:TetR/AcrR family transcriptional regulator [Polaribacter sp. HL-MS24]|uniref:TetR/AcrR family transcriptional regulator n=1 Tax=Polaribacter sp. HL-MS24 TaxID=3077735 RepID=UPI00293504ED|nr:TetR/AcrR family transcriptional regulator [Polaribacter sp. HL-MS24]WOC40157.1 TetR/AcrR family transcriptional regulator [Polaribacter sp. HL-MS24]
MQHLLGNIKISIPDKIYIKDPETSELGKKILEHSILLIDEIGFENFTFKKLGLRINSNESSIYRYFESKHKLLLYLTSWYWSWLEYQLVIETYSIQNQLTKLEKVIEVVTRAVTKDSNFTHINEILLYKIIVNEGPKSYLTKNVDAENKEGYFTVYKRLISRIQETITSIHPKYPYALSLASTLLEGAIHQHYLKEHFPTLTSADSETSITQYFNQLVKNAIK